MTDEPGPSAELRMQCIEVATKLAQSRADAKVQTAEHVAKEAAILWAFVKGEPSQ